MIGTWLGHILLGSFFVAGYIAMCNAPWYARLSGVTQTIVIFCLAAVLQGIVWSAPGGQYLYLSLQLLITAYSLLDDYISGWQFGWRWAVLLAFWWLNHPFTVPGTLIVTFVLLGCADIVYRLHVQLHYNWLANGIFALFLSSLYWLTVPTATLAIQGRYILLFIIMNAYAFLNWVHDHHEEMRQKQLANQVNFDTLTNAGSLAMFRADAQAAFALARTRQTSLTVMTLDIDSFKNVNDTYGHSAGDAALVHMSSLLSDFLQDVNANYRLYRTGGEEFAVIIPNQNTEQFMPTAQQCLETVRRARFDYNGRSNRLTVSVGMTEMRATDNYYADVVQRADRNMYLSKQRGRDCITVNGMTPETSHLREVTMTYTFFTQPIVNIATSSVMASEVRLRMYDDGHWRPADHFDISATTLSHVLTHVAEQLSVKRLNGDFSLEELQTETVHDGLINFINSTDTTFTIEITAIDNIDTFRHIAARYHKDGFKFALANSGWEISYQDACDVIDMVDMVKFTMDQPGKSGLTPEQYATISEWRNLAAVHGLPFIMHGIDSDRDLRLARSLGIEYGQGFYFSRSVLPRIV